MTASKTANLGLMNPVGADPFTTADFADSFTKLDAVPGTLVVPNEASRPSGWSASQHGRMVWQADLNVLWTWYQPSSGSSGVWKRVSNVGWLGGASNPSTINTTAVSWSSAPTICSASIMVPGGRRCMIVLTWQLLQNDHSGQCRLIAVTNGNPAAEWTRNGFPQSVNGPVGGPAGTGFQSGTHIYFRSSSATQEQVNFQFRIASKDPAIVGSYWGGGTTAIQWGTLDVYET